MNTQIKTFPTNELLYNFQEFYESFSVESIDRLSSLYSESVVFIDPIHKIQGIKQLTQYFNQMCGNLSFCQFEFTDCCVSEGKASYRWVMHYRHPRISNNKLLTLKGASFIEYSDKIDLHEDYYDLGEMLYEHIPVLGKIINTIKSKVAKQ